MSDIEPEHVEPSVLLFDAGRRRNPLRRVEKSQCAHLAVAIDEEAETVTCKACRKEIAPFAYLVLLAREWDLRAYKDDQARNAWAQLEQERRNAMARGRLYVRPVDGAALRAWQLFARYLDREPFSIYRRGNAWYLAEDDGTQVSEDYAALELRRREMAKEAGAT